MFANGAFTEKPSADRYAATTQGKGEKIVHIVSRLGRHSRTIRLGACRARRILGEAYARSTEWEAIRALGVKAYIRSADRCAERDIQGAPLSSHAARPPGVLHGFIRTRPSDREHFLNLRIYVELREIAGSCGSFQRRAMPASLVTVRHRARQLAHRHHQVPKSRVQMPSTAHVIQRGCQQRRASVLPMKNVSATNFTPWPSGLLAYHSIFVRIPAYSGIMSNGE